MKERGFYIVLILCVAAVGVSGYFFVRSTQTADGDEPTVTLSEQKDPAGSNPTTTDKPGEDTAETLNPNLDADEQIRETAQSVTVWPLKGEILTTFSADALVFNETMQDWRVHEGIDIAASAGATVSAAQAAVGSRLTASTSASSREITRFFIFSSSFCMKKTSVPARLREPYRRRKGRKDPLVSLGSRCGQERPRPSGHSD